MSKTTKLRYENFVERIPELQRFADLAQPGEGWIRYIRKSLNMSLRQLGKRLKISLQSVKELEDRERNGTLTLKGLSNAAEAMGMRPVIALVPKEASPDSFVEKHARLSAFKTVMKMSRDLTQADEDADFDEQIKLTTEKLIKNMSKEIWE